MNKFGPRGAGIDTGINRGLQNRFTLPGAPGVSSAEFAVVPGAAVAAASDPPAACALWDGSSRPRVAFRDMFTSSRNGRRLMYVSG
mmetsp:Transcript_135232/g.233817  ORF Transcript_135232/g.233817 Transcript_135232/m.233817 type:complete len:86 (-) Transcript_135232:1219-1476(-)